MSEITETSLYLSHYTHHSERVGHWLIFPYLSFSCKCSISGWTFIAMESSQGNSEEHIHFQIWRWKTNITLDQVASVPVKRSNVTRLSFDSSINTSLVEVQLDRPVDVKEGDILGVYQPSSEKSGFILQFQKGLAPGYYLHFTDTPTSQFVIRGVDTGHDYPLVSVEHGQSCIVETLTSAETRDPF